MIELVLLVLGILYLCGFSVGKGLAICAIVKVALSIIIGVLKKIDKQE